MSVLVIVLILVAAVAAAVSGALSVVGRLLEHKERSRPDPAGPEGVHLPEAPGGVEDHTIRVDDGAALATTVLRPAPGDGDPDRPAVVLAHGWGAGRRAWGPVARRLVAAGHTVVVYDQRGHGSSTRGREPIAVDRLGRDLATVLDQLELTGAIVAGHSGGGFAAMAYAAADPRAASRRLRGLALVATAAHDQDASAAEVRLMGSRFLSWVASRPHAGLVPLRQTLGDAPGFAALDATRDLFATTPAAVRGDCFRASRGMDLRTGLAGVDVPAVVLHGDKDGIIAPDLGRAVASALPHARFEEVPGAGHMLPLEAPDRVAASIVELAGQSAPLAKA
jgi:pimeloyl-ACP methyl ester carboxylesterase